MLYFILSTSECVIPFMNFGVTKASHTHSQAFPDMCPKHYPPMLDTGRNARKQTTTTITTKTEKKKEGSFQCD